MMNKKSRVGLINVKYSDNLGDGVIAECIEHQLMSTHNLHVSSIDISGKTAYPSASSDSANDSGVSTLKRAILEKSPTVIQSALIFGKTLYDSKVTMKKKWTRHLQNYDYLVIGGGHLFSDYRMYFPLRIGALIQLANKFNTAVAVYAVGVNPSFSQYALKTFAVLRQSNLVYTSFRSQNDAENWKTNFQLGVNDIVRDPALLSHQVYGIDLAAKKQALLARKRKIVGVNVMSDNLVKRESSTPQSIPSNTELFLRLGQLLVEAGYDVCYFTNGSSDDEKVKEHIESMISPEMAKRVTFKDKLSTPTALVQTISNLDCLVAHRLHANIISYSLQIPHIGLGWSLKVKDFFQSVDREPFFLPSENLTAELILDTIEQAIHQGIPEEKHRAVIQQTQHGLDQLTANLSSST